MPTSITQLESEDGARTILRVAGTLTLEDAELLERICAGLREQALDKGISIDLADLNFLDSESASVLHRLIQEGVELDGLHYFIQKEIELAEKKGIGT